MGWHVAVLIVVGYVVGAIPFGLLSARWCQSQDPRTAGSGNIGFTNVLRVSGKKAGVLTLVCDVGKGLVVAWVARRLILEEQWVFVCVFAVICGHIFSVFLRFQGGKGVATALGGILGLDYVLGTCLLLIWIGVVILSKYSSGGALAAFGLLPIISFVLGYSATFLVFSILVSFLIIWRHKDNIGRLVEGTEGKTSIISS